MAEITQTQSALLRVRRVADDPPESPRSVGWTEGKSLRIVDGQVLALEKGGSISAIDVEYEMYGKLSMAKDNVVLICHALSGDAHVAGWDKNCEQTGRLYRKKHPGWWDTVIGPGEGDRYAEVLRGVRECAGVVLWDYRAGFDQPGDGEAVWVVVPGGDGIGLGEGAGDTVGEVGNRGGVRCVIGGSLGGQQALEWALAYPERVERAIVFAAAHRLSTQGGGL